jgi:Fur family ferric uptake transcriptional regulator
MISPMAPTVDQMLSALRRRGHRLTGQRRAILDGVASSGGHISADAVHRAVSAAHPTVDRSTVYRTLALLAEAGVIDALAHEPGQTCYRLCGPLHHHHLVCGNCHRVVELEGQELEAPLRALAGRHGFAAIEHRLELVGTCVPCSEKTAA